MRIPEQQSQRERSRRAVTPRHRRALATGVIIVITTALSLMAGATTEFAASAVPVTEGSAINLDSGLIGAQAPTTFPLAYAGEEINDAEDLTIYLAQPAPALEAWIAGLVGGAFSIQYVAVQHSYQQLLSMEHAIAITDRAELVAEGVDVVAINPNPAANDLVVTLATPASATAPSPSSSSATTSGASNTIGGPDSSVASYIASGRSVLQGAFGASWVSVSDTTMVPVQSIYRNNDYAPFYGGDDLYDPYNGDDLCTSGFSVTGGGDYYQYTAAHCFPIGASIYIYNNGSMGNYVDMSAASGLESEGYDFELICESSSGGIVWGGTASDQTYWYVNNETNPPDGSAMTLDGAVTGEVRGLDVTMQDGCIQGSSGCCAEWERRRAQVRHVTAAIAVDPHTSTRRAVWLRSW